MRDDDLRARFHDLRRADAGAPGFSAVVDRATSVAATPAPHRAPGVWIAAAAAVVAGLVATQRFVATKNATAQTLTTWQSPTAILVPASGRAVLDPPPLLSSVLDGATSSALWPKGD